MNIEHLYHPSSGTLTWLVHDEHTGDAVVIDPVLDFEPEGSRLWTASLDLLLAMAKARGLRVRAIFDTHLHADHVTGASVLRRWTGAMIVMGEGFSQTRRVLASRYERTAACAAPPDRLAVDGEVIELGSLRVRALATPGHTPSCTTWRIDDALFVGDTLFMPDLGTGRCDFPGGSAHTLYDSVQRLYALPEDLRIFVGHDYQPGGRELRVQTTVGQSRRQNRHLRAETTLDDFVALREERDRGLSLPRLMHAVVPLNLDLGALPGSTSDHQRSSGGLLES